MYTQPQPRKNFIPLVLLCLVPFLLCSCNGEGGEEDSTAPPAGYFSAAEMSILNANLNLPSDLLNYANLPLPAHFTTRDAPELDNTPESNPITDIGATLGRVLFYDKQLSANNTISCASCHKQNAGFSDNEVLSLGIEGRRTKRNSMTLINSRYYENGRFMWDERAATLEEQVLMPIQDHNEMAMNLDDLVTKLQQLDYYDLLFEKTFGSPEVTTDRIAKALSQYTRSIVSYRSKFDEGLVAAGNPDVYEDMPLLPNFTEQEKLGQDIFLRGRNGATCGYCHGGPQNVNDQAKNNGLMLSYQDQGKGGITGRSADNALFKVPSLRNIALTAPYMHDGRFATLMDVVNHYDNNVKSHANLDFRLTNSDDPSPNAEVLKLNLTQEEKEALVAFLHTLTDHEIGRDIKYSDPFKD